MPESDDAPGAPAGPVARRWLVAFGHFWWEFLIGDTPELFVGAVCVIGVLALLCLHPGLRTLAAYLAPVLVTAVLVASVGRSSAA